jgi:hypothetical protein
VGGRGMKGVEGANMKSGNHDAAVIEELIIRIESSGRNYHEWRRRIEEQLKVSLKDLLSHCSILQHYNSLDGNGI